MAENTGDAAYWKDRYEALRGRVERMARETGRVRTPAELRALLDDPSDGARDGARDG